MDRISMFMAISSIWLPVFAAEPTNLLNDPSLEAVVPTGQDSGAWEIKEFGHIVEADAEIKQDGRFSIKITSGEEPKGSSLRQEIAASAIREQAYRFSGAVRTRDLRGTAMLTVVVDRSNGQRYMDWMQGRGASGNTEWKTLNLNIPRFEDAESVAVSALVTGTGVAWFDSLDVSAIDTNEKLPTEVAEYIDTALDIMERSSIVRDSVDWSLVRKETRTAAIGSTNVADAYPAIKYAVHMLGDNHSGFYSPETRLKLSRGETQEGLPSVRRSPRGQVLENRYGYIEVPAFRGTEDVRMTGFADHLHNQIEDMDNERLCGWIVDLRWNTGGNVFPMLAGIGPILGEGDAGGGITADGNIIPRSYFNGKSGTASVSRTPYEVIKQDPPVAILLGPRTASSGEATALAFIGRSKTRSFGAASGGLTTGNRLFPMPDGAGLNLAVTKMVDRKGRVYGGDIEPDVRVAKEVIEDPTKDPTVEVAVEWLSSHCEPVL